MKKNSTKGKQCYVVCSSGVSCEAYDGVATTIHSRCGLQTCELPATLLVERALKRNNIVDLIGEMDILIWDEVSMSSKRILELINLLHHKVLKNALYPLVECR